MITKAAVFPDSKSHYEILDGLRGVAAILVVLFHVLEIFSGGDHTKQIINHGYLAVDFFFLLSGFVIGHAYDDRWKKMTLGNFFKRRLIRLHPMIVMGMIIGAIAFYFSASPELFPGISQVPYSKLILVMLIGFTLLPLPISLDIRGWQEMHPLNGPAWSLFFEYIANILYALVLVKLPNKVLLVLALLAAFALVQLAVTSDNGDVIGGWSLDAVQLRIGITRLSYPFLAGLLLSRVFHARSTKSTFLLCSLLLTAVLACPRIGGHEQPWMNGLYDSLCIIIIFPLVVYLGAGGNIRSSNSLAVCRFLGELSYPLYMVHYPFIYIFSAYVVNNHLVLKNGWFMGAVVFVGVMILAYAVLKLYDLPVRNWLSKKFIRAKKIR